MFRRIQIQREAVAPARLVHKQAQVVRFEHPAVRLRLLGGQLQVARIWAELQLAVALLQYASPEIKNRVLNILAHCQTVRRNAQRTAGISQIVPSASQKQRSNALASTQTRPMARSCVTRMERVGSTSRLMHAQRAMRMV